MVINDFPSLALAGKQGGLKVSLPKIAYAPTNLAKYRSGGH